jgi:hypothetical protein
MTTFWRELAQTRLGLENRYIEYLHVLDMNDDFLAGTGADKVGFGK